MGYQDKTPNLRRKIALCIGFFIYLFPSMATAENDQFDIEKGFTITQKEVVLTELPKKKKAVDFQLACEPNSKIIGGGYQIITPAKADVDFHNSIIVIKNYPDFPNSIWRTTLLSKKIKKLTVKLTAICLGPKKVVQHPCGSRNPAACSKNYYALSGASPQTSEVNDRLNRNAEPYSFIRIDGSTDNTDFNQVCRSIHKTCTGVKDHNQVRHEDGTILYGALHKCTTPARDPSRMALCE